MQLPVPSDLPNASRPTTAILRSLAPLHLLAYLLLLAPVLLSAQSHSEINHAEVAAHVRGAMSFLASDAMRGRGSATSDEMVAATYVVSQFQSLGLDKAELQRVALPSGAVTYNAYAVLRGSDPALAGQTILISSHLDHLGTRQSPNGEVIFHGADDDASGTSAVLELARALASHRPRPARRPEGRDTGGSCRTCRCRSPRSSTILNLR